MTAKKQDYSLNFLQHHLPTTNGQRLYAQEACMMTAANAIVEAMERSGKNRAWLAQSLGKSQGFVSQVLSGNRNMTLKTFADFAFALGLEVEKIALAPLGESLISIEAMDRWLDEESLIAQGEAEVTGSFEYKSTGSVSSTAQEAAFVG